METPQVPLFRRDAVSREGQGPQDEGRQRQDRRNEEGFLQDQLRGHRLRAEGGWLKAKRKWGHSGQAPSLALTPLSVRALDERCTYLPVGVTNGETEA